MPTIPHAVQHLSRTIMTDALDGHAGTVSIGGRPLTNSQKRSCRVQSKVEGEGVARESDGKIISRIGLVYVLLNP